MKCSLQRNLIRVYIFLLLPIFRMIGKNRLNSIKLFPTNMKLLSAFMFAAYIQVHVRLDVMEGNTINPDH